MKKNMENLLFSLLESGSVELNGNNKLVVFSNNDPLSLKISQSPDFVDQVKLEVFWNATVSSTNALYSTMLDEQEIKNFLLVSNHTLELRENQAFITEHGQNKFNELKDVAYSILMQKKVKNFIPGFLSKNEQGALSMDVEEKEIGTTSHIVMHTNKLIDNIHPLKIEFHNIIRSKSGLVTSCVFINIPKSELQKYSLLSHRPFKNSTHEDIFDAILNSSMSNHSKALNYFKLQTSLAEKPENKSLPKI